MVIENAHINKFEDLSELGFDFLGEYQEIRFAFTAKLSDEHELLEVYWKPRLHKDENYHFADWHIPGHMGSTSLDEKRTFEHEGEEVEFDPKKIWSNFKENILGTKIHEFCTGEEKDKYRDDFAKYNEKIREYIMKEVEDIIGYEPHEHPDSGTKMLSIRNFGQLINSDKNLDIPDNHSFASWCRAGRPEFNPEK